MRWWQRDGPIDMNDVHEIQRYFDPARSLATSIPEAKPNKINQLTVGRPGFEPRSRGKKDCKSGG
jgi:hypothetical protein